MVATSTTTGRCCQTARSGTRARVTSADQAFSRRLLRKQRWRPRPGGRVDEATVRIASSPLDPMDPVSEWTSPRLVDTQLRVYHHPRRSIMARKRRTYTPEFKAEAVQLVTAQGYSVAEAAR